MKKLFSTISLILFFSTINQGAQKPHFSITCDLQQSKYSMQYVVPFEKIMTKFLLDEFPCADVASSSSIRGKLDIQRDNELQGKTDVTNVIMDIGKDFPHDYWVYLGFHDYIDGQVQIFAKCFKHNKFDCIANTSILTVDRNDGSVTNACNKISKELIDILNQKEICPFIGPVSITVNSIKDSTELIEYDVYCNESDQRYRKETVIKNSTYSDWKLQKKSFARTDGTMTFKTNESTRITEEDGCHKCKTGREGARTYTYETSLQLEGSGISHESSFEGKPQEDTRIELEFLVDGTYNYYIIAKGTSLPVTGEERSTEEAQGTCDNIPRAKKTKAKVIRIPLWVVFGPYPGKVTDDVLQHKDSKVVRNLNDEKLTVTIDFNLSRKAK